MLLIKEEKNKYRTYTFKVKFRLYAVVVYAFINMYLRSRVGTQCARNILGKNWEILKSSSYIRVITAVCQSVFCRTCTHTFYRTYLYTREECSAAEEEIRITRVCVYMFTPFSFKYGMELMISRTVRAYTQTLGK